MKFLALLIALLAWLFLVSLLKIQLNFSYCYQNLSSHVVLDVKILFSTLKIELNLPKSMYFSGIESFITNVLETGAEDECKDKPKPKPQKTNKNRYRYLKHLTGEIWRHYVSSFSRVLWIKRKLTALSKSFYKKINVYSLRAAVQIGGRDAAETGLLVGVFWAFFGQMTARLYRWMNVKKHDIRYNVIPRFDDELFLCRLHCILSLKISHIIFTGYKFLLLIFKNRRIRNYGRAPN